MTDSWKTDGNCNECCRKNYCNKMCRLARERGQAMIYNAFRQTTVGKAYDEIMKSEFHDFTKGE